MTHASDLLTNRARLTPDRQALFDLHSGQRYSYAELNRRANQAANFLRAHYHIHKGDRVSILAFNSIAYVDLLFGLGKIGAIFAPLNWRLTGKELTYIVNDCQPKVLIVGPEFASLAEEMRSSIAVESFLSLDGARLAESQAYEALLAQASDAEPEQPSLSEEDAYCILYTSGTTGNPKGAVLPHRQIYWNAVRSRCQAI